MRASDRAYEALRGDILAWRIAPGTPLSEVELAEGLGVSRTPLRAALARLALEGLVDTTRGRTALVSEVSPGGIVELFELRSALETHAARLAARRRDPEVFDRLARDFAAAASSLDDGRFEQGRFEHGRVEHGRLDGARIDDYYALVARFDAALDAAVANPAFRGALDGVRTHLQRARRIASDNAARLRRSADEHRLICEAIRDGDETLAESATSVHLRAALTTILATLETPIPATPNESSA